MAKKQYTDEEEKLFDLRMKKALEMSLISTIGVNAFLLEGNILYLTIGFTIISIILFLINISMYKRDGSRDKGFPIWNFLIYIGLLISVAMIAEHTLSWYFFLAWYTVCLINIANGFVEAENKKERKKDNSSSTKEKGDYNK